MPSPEQKPDPEVLPQARRRTFSASYKRRILDQVDECSESGEIGALLRREGLYSSYLTKWRQQREDGILSGLNPKKRGRKKESINPLARRVETQEREIARLKKKLEHAEVIIDFQKKASELMGIALTPEKSRQKP